MSDSHSYLDLYDFRLRVAAMYADRTRSLDAGEDPEEVLMTFRGQRDDLFAVHPQSALDPVQKGAFTTLDYYPYNPDACVEAMLDTDVPPKKLEIATSGDEVMPMHRVGAVRFTYDGLSLALSLYWIDVYGGGLFLPFKDLTAPRETYGGGRYLFDTVKGSDFRWLGGQGGRHIELDFNYAYNPSCAYNHRWVCPLAPSENVLQAPIPAGEKRFHGPSSY